MPNFTTSGLNSLKEMASFFQQNEKKQHRPSAKNTSNKKTTEKEPLAMLPEPEEEEYIEFPVLNKHKTYDIDVLKPVKRQLPSRVTVLQSTISSLKISLKDSEVYEQAVIRKELQPFLLKSSHAVFSNLESVDEIHFSIDFIGNSYVKVTNNQKVETMELGCIIRYEFERFGTNSLIVTSRDLDVDAEVLGGPCKIEFHLPEIPEKEEKAVLRQLNVDSELNQLNKEAGHSIKWLA